MLVPRKRGAVVPQRWGAAFPAVRDLPLPSSPFCSVNISLGLLYLYLRFSYHRLPPFLPPAPRAGRGGGGCGWVFTRSALAFPFLTQTELYLGRCLRIVWFGRRTKF